MILYTWIAINYHWHGNGYLIIYLELHQNQIKALHDWSIVMRPQLYPISIDKKPAKLPYIPCVRECVVTDLTKGFLWYIYYYTILRCVLAISPPGKFVSSRKQQLVKQRFTVHGYRVKMGLVRSGGTANPVCCTDHLVCGSGVPKLSVPRSCTCTDGHACMDRNWHGFNYCASYICKPM